MRSVARNTFPNTPSPRNLPISKSLRDQILCWEGKENEEDGDEDENEDEDEHNWIHTFSVFCCAAFNSMEDFRGAQECLSASIATVVIQLTSGVTPKCIQVRLRLHCFIAYLFRLGTCVSDHPSAQ